MVDGEAELAEDVEVVVERRGQGLQHLALQGHELAALPAVLVDVLHAEATHIEAQAQVARTQHIVQVGHVGELLGHEAAVERVQPSHAVVLATDVGLHEADVRRQVLEERTGEGAAEHGDAHLGVLHGQRVDHGHDHGHVAQRREADDEDMLSAIHLFDYRFSTSD